MEGVRNVVLDAHPQDMAVVLRYQIDSTGQEQRQSQQHKIINLKEMSPTVDVVTLASLIMSKCSIIPESNRRDLEQILFYLQKRQQISRSRSASALSLGSIGSVTSIKASMDKLGEYVDLLYEDESEKNRAAACILELAKSPSNVVYLAENQTLVSALGRVLRDDWKKNLELAKNILLIFVQFSSFTQTRQVVIDHALGKFCLTCLELEIARGESWITELKSGDEKTIKKCHIALRKEQSMLGACVGVLLHLADALPVEMRMLRRGLLPLLSRCLLIAPFPSPSSDLLLPVVLFLLKLSIFIENVEVMTKEKVVERLVALFPLNDSEVRKTAIQTLFNLSFFNSMHAEMISAGLLQRVAPLIHEDGKALNLFYQLTQSADAKTLLPLTDSIQLLMCDALSSSGSQVTKAALLNAAIDKRSAQLIAGPTGQGLDALLNLCLHDGDLLAGKIVRNIAAHQGPTQELFIKWLPSLLAAAKAELYSPEEAKAARALECLAISAQIAIADWPKLINTFALVPWLTSTLKTSPKPEHNAVQLQQVVLIGTAVSSSVKAGESLLPLLDALLSLLHSEQEDDEFVCELLFVFLSFLRHGSLSSALLQSDSALPVYMLDLMHDSNARVRSLSEVAVEVIGERSEEWAGRIRTENFRFHNAQWLEMVEREDAVYGEEGGEDHFGEVHFDHHYLDYDDDEDPARDDGSSSHSQLLF